MTLQPISPASPDPHERGCQCPSCCHERVEADAYPGRHPEGCTCIRCEEARDRYDRGIRQADKQ